MTRQVIAVPGRPGFNALLWWFQGPESNVAQYKFELDGKPYSKPVQVVPVGNLVGKSNNSVAQRTFLLVTAHVGEAPGNNHQLRVIYKGQVSNTARSRTLPASPDGLQMVLASCFYAANSQLQAATPLPDQYLPPYSPPHVKMLCGDQIYLDLSWGGFVPRTNISIWDRYEEQWHSEDFLAWMANGGNLCIADDHEFWNNYPSTVRVTPWLNKLFKAPSQPFVQQMHEAFIIYQGVLNANPDKLRTDPGQPLKLDDLYCFEFPGDDTPPEFSKYFNLLVLDTRTQRSTKPGQFTNPVWLNTVTTKITTCIGPTLLVTSQPILAQPGGPEANLSDYSNQFALLWEAIWKSQHQVLLLTGDIHWSRAQRFKSQYTGIQHYEIVSSALARIYFDAPLNDFSKLQSRVKWNGRAVQATRIGDSEAPCTYAILSFANSAVGLNCMARWWEIKGDGKHYPINMAAGPWDRLDPFNIAKPLYHIDFYLR